MRRHLSIAKAKARFAESIRLAESGETVVLTRHGRPVAQLGPVATANRRTLGLPDEVQESASRYDTPLEEGAKAPETGAVRSRREALERLLEEAIWPEIPEEQLGVRLDKAAREEILGYGSQGI